MTVKDVISKSFVSRVPGWLRLAELPYGQLRAEYLKHHEGDEAYKSFSEVFSRLVGERSRQPPASSDTQDQQKDEPHRTKTTFLNDPSSGGEGPVGKANMQRTDIVRNSERQTLDPPGEVSSRREVVGLSALSSVDEDPVTNADSKNTEIASNSGRQKSETSEYYRSVQWWRLECAVEEVSTDTVTVLQGAFMKDGVERLATPQETILMHTVYKAVISWIENKSTGEERQKVFEATLGMPGERLRDFWDELKLICIKRSVARGELTEWDAEANTWCVNVFKIISEAWPILKDIREFHDLLTAADIAVTPESRITVAPQTPRTKGKSRKSERN